MGIVENVGDNLLADIEVGVTLNDGETVIGDFVDTSSEDIDYLRPGNNWRFDVVFEDKNLFRSLRRAGRQLFHEQCKCLKTDRDSISVLFCGIVP